MLSLQALSTAAATVANMEARGKIVAPIGGSVLDSMVKACHVPLDLPFRQDDGSYSVDLGSVQHYANSSDVVTGGCEHSLAQEEVVQMLADKVTGYLNHARTVVAPAVEEFARHLDEAVSLFRNDLAHDFEIVTQGLPALLADPSILNAIKGMERATINDYALPVVGLPHTDDVNVMAMMMTGSPVIDQVIAEWVNQQGPDFLSKVWNTVFSVSTAPRSAMAADVFSNTESGLAMLTASYLIARKIWDNPMEGVGVSLKMWQDKMVELRDDLAARLNYFVEQDSRNMSANILVRSMTSRKIVVNLPVYTKWIKAGGTNEVLFGNALSGKANYTTDDIDENADLSAKAWERYSMMQRVNFDNRMFLKFKDVASAEFDRVLRTASHEEMPLNMRDVIIQKFNQQLDMTTAEEVKDLNCWSLRLLGKSWFYKSDAYRILKGIADVIALNPEMDPKEAATISALDYIAYWVAGQLKTVAA